MSVQEEINKRPVLVGIVAASVIIVTVMYIAWGTFGSHSSGPPVKAFYSDDDGQTWFVDAADKIPPFDHNGKPACRVHVYRCGDGPPFVSYLERYDLEAKAKAERTMEEALKKGPSWGGHDEAGTFLQMKRPGDKMWTAATDPAAIARITQPVCPDGKSDGIRPVIPGE